MKNSTIKGLFLLAAILGAMSLYVFTQFLIRDVRVQQKQKVDLWVKSLKLITELDDPQQLSFIFSEIVTVIDFPAILTDAKQTPSTWRNLDIDTSRGADGIRDQLLHELESMDAQHEPVAVKLDTVVLQYVHYGDSRLVRVLRVVPWATGAAGILFILITYSAFSYIRRNEQSSIWVGLSRETAHQLGTPISSLMGWVELLKSSSDNPERQAQTIFEMQTDINRLNRVATRFSKIGSKAKLEPENVNSIVESMFQYLRPRIPQSGKKIELLLTDSADKTAPMNRDLMEWVIENLTKNGIDAIQHKDGKIIATISDDDTHVFIDITDTGKGIESKNKTDIFRAGFTTKARGWGLGLSLAKRIVEDYHGGKLLLKETALGKGTTFRIKLPKSAA
jgi:signal transduction histidine kinase